MEKIPFLLNYIYNMGRQKGVNKQKVGFSIDKEIANQLNQFCDDNSINKSHLINKLIKKYLEKNTIEIHVKENCMDN